MVEVTKTHYNKLCVTWATSVPILVFLGRPLCSRIRSDIRDRQTSDKSIRPIRLY